jgi:hypothetical protein
MDRLCIEKLSKHLYTLKLRSKWKRGIREYAEDLLNDLEFRLDDYGGDINEKMFLKALLNGAFDWNEYSRGGCSLIYDEDIAERLCTPSELRKVKNGDKPPSKWEDWMDVQTRALKQAYDMLIDCYNRIDVTEVR